MWETFKIKIIVNYNSWLLFATFTDGLKTFITELNIFYYFCKLPFCRLNAFLVWKSKHFYMRKGYCTITKKLLSFLALRSLLYYNLPLEAIFIISMVMVVEGVGGLGYGILCTWEIELRNHTIQDYNWRGWGLRDNYFPLRTVKSF